MPLKLVDAGGTLQTITSLKLRDGGGIKTIRSLKLLDTDGTTLRTVATFASPLTVSATNAIKTSTVDGPATVTASSLATPSGGLAPFTYAWSVLTGTFAASGGATAGQTFTATLDVGESSNGTAKVIVTDAAGSTAESTITVTLSNAGSLGGGTA